MTIFKDILSNNVLLSALYSWFLAQFLKITIEVVKRNRFKTKDFVLRALLGTGGMPSSHSASISSVAVSIGITSGFGSPLFALAFVMVFIVIRDATGVRLSAGRQAQVLNMIIEELYIKHNLTYKKLKEVRGHTALECFVGVIIGIFVSLGIYLL